MLARLVLFNFGLGMREAANELAADMGPLIRGMNGCKSATFFGDDTDGQYGLFVLWESQEHVDSAAAVIGPQLMSLLEGKTTEEPSRRLYNVIG